MKMTMDSGLDLARWLDTSEMISKAMFNTCGSYRFGFRIPSSPKCGSLWSVDRILGGVWLCSVPRSHCHLKGKTDQIRYWRPSLRINELFSLMTKLVPLFSNRSPRGIKSLAPLINIECGFTLNAPRGLWNGLFWQRVTRRVSIWLAARFGQQAAISKLHEASHRTASGQPDRLTGWWLPKRSPKKSEWWISLILKSSPTQHWRPRGLHSELPLLWKVFDWNISD